MFDKYNHLEYLLNRNNRYVNSEFSDLENFVNLKKDIL